MLPAAIEKAKGRLLKAETAFEKIKACHQLHEIEPVWSDYLIALNGIFTILEQGAKANIQSRQWFGGKKALRRKDSMLSYLKQARNCDEHDIPSIVNRDVGSTITFPDRQPNGQIISKVIYTPVGGTPVVIAENENGVVGTIPAYVLTLLKVRDERFGTEFDPPTEHLGKTIENPRPVGVAELGLIYARALIAEAEALVP